MGSILLFIVCKHIMQIIPGSSDSKASASKASDSKASQSNFTFTFKHIIVQDSKSGAGLPWYLRGYKRLPAMEETQVRSLGWEDFPGEGNGNPLQYSCLENPMDGGTWWATVHGVAKSRTRLSNFTSLQQVKKNDLCYCLTHKLTFSYLLHKAKILFERTTNRQNNIFVLQYLASKPATFRKTTESIGGNNAV